MTIGASFGTGGELEVTGRAVKSNGHSLLLKRKVIRTKCKGDFF